MIGASPSSTIAPWRTVNSSKKTPVANQSQNTGGCVNVNVNANVNVNVHVNVKVNVKVKVKVKVRSGNVMQSVL